MSIVCGVRPRREAVSRSMHQTGLQCAVLQIAIHILDLGDRLQPPFHDGRPCQQVLPVVALQRVLELRIAAAPADLNVLQRLHEERCARNRSQLGPQAIHHFEDAHLALSQRLQRDADIRRNSTRLMNPDTI